MQKNIDLHLYDIKTGTACQNFLHILNERSSLNKHTKKPFFQKLHMIALLKLKCLPLRCQSSVLLQYLRASDCHQNSRHVLYVCENVNSGFCRLCVQKRQFYLQTAGQCVCVRESILKGSECCKSKLQTDCVTVQECE